MSPASTASQAGRRRPLPVEVPVHHVEAGDQVVRRFSQIGNRTRPLRFEQDLNQAGPTLPLGVGEVGVVKESSQGLFVVHKVHSTQLPHVAYF